MKTHPKSLPFESMMTFVELFAKQDSLGEREITLLELFRSAAIKIMKKLYPSVGQVGEFVSIVSAGVKGQDDYWEAVSTYLSVLASQKGLIAPYHIQGLVDLIRLGSRDDRGWLEGKATQIFERLKENGLLYQTKGLTTSEVHERLQLWQHLCYALEESRVPVTDFDTFQEEIFKVIDSYQSIVSQSSGAVVSDGLTRVMCESIKWSLSRTPSDASSDWIKVASHLRSALMNGTEAAIASGLAPVTFGVSALAAVKPGIDMLKNLSYATSQAIASFKKSYDKDKTGKAYIELRKLQSLLWIHASDPNKTEGKDFTDFVGEIKKLQELKNPELNQLLAYGLAEELRAIAISFKKPAYYNAIFGLLRDSFLVSDHVGLKAVLFDALMSIDNQSNCREMDQVMLALLRGQTKEFSEGPLSERFIDEFVEFYARVQHDVGIQAILLARLSRQSSQSPKLVARIMHQIKKVGDDAKIPIPQPFLDTMSDESKCLLRVGNFAESRIRPPLVLLTWFSSLNRDELTKFLGDQGVAPVGVFEDQGSTALFGKVGRMVVALAVHGTQIHYPESLTTASDLADFVARITHISRKNESNQDSIKGSDATDAVRGKLADNVGTAFVGHYVGASGLQVGISTGILNEAVKLAREWGQEKDQPVAGQKTSSVNSSSQVLFQSDKKSTMTTLQTDCFKVSGSSITIDYDVLYDLLGDHWHTFCSTIEAKLKHPSLDSGKTKKDPESEGNRTIFCVYKSEKGAFDVQKKLLQALSTEIGKVKLEPADGIAECIISQFCFIFDQVPSEQKSTLTFDYDKLYDYIEDGWESFYTEVISKLSHPFLMTNQTQRDDGDQKRVITYHFRSENSAKCVQKRLVHELLLRHPHLGGTCSPKP